MSAISSQLSFPSSGHWNLNPRVFNIMDSIYAIAFGLGLRTLVDAVSQDLKLTGSLIGLWEGVITLHFVKKMPKSSDPYIAYGVRLFIDFLITESMERMVLVLIWTAFGLVLADVTPAIWDEVGLNRVWRHFRRDLYTIYDKIPTVAFFPPQRTVRFLPPREREREREPGDISPSPSLAPSQDTPLAVIPPLPSELSESLKHRVPGYYPGDYSDTDTDFGSINRSRISLRTEVNDAIVSDLDEGNQSSAITSPALTQEEIPDMDEVLVDVGIEEVLPVPIPKEIAFPPTPSDSAARWDIHRDVVDGVLNAKPPGQDLPDILDLGEDGGTSDDWEKIQRRDYDENGSPSPPTPPAKDRPVGGGLLVQISPIIPPAIPPVSSPITDNRRESLPPAYSSHHNDDLDDIYYYPEKHTVTATDDHANVNEHVGNDNNDSKDLSKIPFQQAGDSDTNTGTNANPWAAPTSSDVTAQVRGDAEIQAEEAAERKRKEEEESRLKEAEEEIKRMEEEKIRKEEEAKQMVEEAKLKEEKQRKEDEEERLKVEEAKRKEEEEAKRKEEDETKRKEEDETKRKEEEAKRKEEEEAKRKEEEAKRKEEEEAKRKEEEAKRKEEEAKRKEEEAKRKEEEEAKRKEEEEAKRKEEEEAKRKEEEAKREEEERKRKEAEETLKAQQAEELRREKEAEKKRRADEAAERKKKEDDDNALRKQRQAEAEQKRKDEEAEKKRKEAEQKEKEEAERKRQDEAAAHAQNEAEEAEAKPDKRNADTPGDQATEEKEDDSKTVHELDISGGQPQQGPSESENVQDSTTPPHGDFTEEESVISTVTIDPPQEAEVRLERMMILRAQMVEVEKRLDELEEKGLDEANPEMKATEKSLRKYMRQAERRYNAGVKLARCPKDPYDTHDEVSLDGLSPPIAGVKIEEKLEKLLTPTSHSIHFKLIFGSNAKRQKPVVLNILTKYNLFDYTITSEKNKKEYSIEISEEKFAGWLTAYRTSVAKRDSENADDGDNEGWNSVYY